jgi:hypothetical protein
MIVVMGAVALDGEYNSRGQGMPLAVGKRIVGVTARSAR